MKYALEIDRTDMGVYVCVRGIVDGAEMGCDDFEMSHAETLSGAYIGEPGFAKQLCGKLGIAPELIDADHQVCLGGFCEREQKWYGWSHRAMFGFGVGSKVVKGDCAYVPPNDDDAIHDAILFWSGDHRENVTAGPIETDEDGNRFVQVSWKNSDTVPNEAMRGGIDGVAHRIPEPGRGEWTAETLDDARQMAVDFAEGVA